MVAQPDSITELAMELGWTMSEMKGRLRQKIQAKINEYDPDLSFELLEIIGLLWRKDGMNQQDIGNIVSKDKSSITYLINCLVKRGLVERVADKNDRRNKLIFLTQKGKQTREKIFPWALELYHQAVGNLGEKEVREALSLLKQMITNLG